jgi:hypothetical protein
MAKGNSNIQSNGDPECPHGTKCTHSSSPKARKACKHRQNGYTKKGRRRG